MDAIIGFMLSCESENQQPISAAGKDNSLSMVFQSSSLPSCNQGTAGKIIYVRESDEFKFCDSESWILIDVSGAQGPTGKEGPQGKSIYTKMGRSCPMMNLMISTNSASGVQFLTEIS